MKKQGSFRAAVLFLLLLSVVSCGETTQAPADDISEKQTGTVTDSAVSETEAEKYLDSLPETMDFGGYEFVISSPAVWNSGDTYNQYLVPEAEIGEIINDTAFQRNKAAEERLNVVISYTPGDDMNVSNRIQKSVTAGEKPCDIAVIEPQYWDSLGPLLSTHALIDWNDIPYITKDASYYFPYVNDLFEVNGKQFALASYYGNSSLLPFHMVFNISMMNDLDIEVPYALIKNGGWTFDRFEEMLKDTYVDLNGDGKMDIGDQFGYVNEGALTNNLFWGFGMNIVDRADDGSYLPAEMNDRLVSAYQRLLSFRDANGNCASPQNFVDFRKSIDMANPFTRGKILFTTTGTGNLHAELRNVSFDVGIAPYPKYDDNQTSYQCNGSVFPLIVPATVTETETVGAVTEVLSALSKQEMEPAVIDVYIEQKVLRDEESVGIFRMMMDSVSIDITMYYRFSPDSKSISPIVFLDKCKSDTVVSKLESVRSATEKNIEKYFAPFYED